MSKSVVINLANGDLHKGFPKVTAQLWVAGHPLKQQFIGSLPAAPFLGELYRNWQSIYKNLCERKFLRSSLELEDDELEIDAGGITNISVVGFDELCQTLQAGINTWLKSVEFLDIERQLRSALQPGEEIRVILETNDELLRRLPWHRWDFFGDYPLAELALSRSEYKFNEPSQPKFIRTKVRILAILGNSKGIDLDTETKFLNGLQDAEVVFLVNPSRQEFNTYLWQADGWDMLFFAGHSQSEGKTGRIYLNENPHHNSLTIDQLEEALKAAISNGLKLAIFNSCDGLGLAEALEKLHLPTVIVMREPVPNRVAQDFFNYFLEAFAIGRQPLYLAVQQARRQLQGLEDDFPGASWLPVICQNPAIEPPTWLQLGGVPECPYRGLFAFQEEDAHLFFGREEFTQELVKAVKTQPLVAVVGASGCGKSSVVFAGLVPHLRRREDKGGSEKLERLGLMPVSYTPEIVSFRPGKNPVEALAIAMAPLCQQLQTHRGPMELEMSLRQDSRTLYKIIESLIQQRFGSRLVLIADQFEELYTQTTPAERQLFLDVLLTAVRLAGAFTLVLTLRADFYGHALSYRPFSDALQGAVHNLGPMSREELQAAIEQPAAQMQVKLDEGLTNKLIHALKEHPGRLPLLEFALTQLWSKQRGGVLTHPAYVEIGGVESALANHAETVYAQLHDAQRLATQRVFMQLVQPGAGMDARRLATRDEVGSENWDLVTQLASARLVVTNCHDTGVETVEIVHEALIRSWGRLQHWLLLDGEFRHWQEQLRAAMRQWESSGKDEGALLRGKPLIDAQDWQSKRSHELSVKERDFIGMSLALREWELYQQKRRRQLTISFLTGGLVVALGLTAVALWQWQNSEKSQIKTFKSSAQTLLTSAHDFDALMASIQAGTRIKHTFGVDADTHTQVVEVLQQALNFVRERNRLSGHDDVVTSVCFSPDGHLIATTSWDNTAKVWSREGQLLTTLKGHHNGVTSVAFNPDSNVLATGSYDKTVKLWSREGKELRTLTGHDGGVNSVSFSPDGNLIVTGSWDKTVKLWSREGKELHSLRGHTDVVNGISFSPDGNLIVTASSDRTVKLWRRDGKLLHTLTGHTDVVAIAAFSPDGNLIATASSDNTIKLWNRDGNELETLNGHDDRVWDASFSPDGQTIATASYDNTVKLWSRESQKLRIFQPHKDIVLSATFSPDGQMISTTSNDKTVKLWSRDGKLLHTLKGYENVVMRTTFSPDSSIIATGGWGHTAKLWNREGKELQTLQGHTDAVNGVSFSPDGNLMATVSSDRTVKLWNRDGKELHTLKGHDDGVNIALFSPDGKTIASASWDKTIKLWNLQGHLLHTLTGHQGGVNSLAFSPDGKTIASASWDKTIKLWNLQGQLLYTLTGHKGGVNNVAFSPDGKTIASASNDKTVKLWNLQGKLLQTLKGHQNWVWSASFSPDGKTIASASQDKKVILWNLERELNLERLLAYSCNWVRDYLQTNDRVSESDRHLCDRR